MKEKRWISEKNAQNNRQNVAEEEGFTTYRQIIHKWSNSVLKKWLNSINIKHGFYQEKLETISRKNYPKSSWKYCGFIDERQIHAHELVVNMVSIEKLMKLLLVYGIHQEKWSNETNSRLKKWCEHGFYRKRSSKKSWKCCGFIHHRQIHAHKWSNKMNSRLKTGCEHDFPIAGDETWLSHSVEQNCSGKMKTSMLICLTLLNVKTALPLKIGM